MQTRLINVPGSTARTVATSGTPGASRTSNVTTITTTAPHGFVVGATVVIAGVTPVGATVFNGTFVILSVPSTTTFTYADAGTNDTGGGGSATPQYLAIKASIPVRQWEFFEDASVTAQGVSMKFPEDNFTAVFGLPTTNMSTPYRRVHPAMTGAAVAPVLGLPAINIPGGSTKPADTLVKIISTTGAATAIQFSEFE